jgi:hypothetical protein
MIPNPYYFIDDLRFIQIKKIYIFYNKYIYKYKYKYKYKYEYKGNMSL